MYPIGTETILPPELFNQLLTIFGLIAGLAYSFVIG